MQITVKVEDKEAQEALRRLNQQNMRAKVAGAVKESLQEGKTEASRRVTARYTRPEYAIQTMRLIYSGLRGKLKSTDHRHSLIKFFARPSTRPPHNPPGGITVMVRRGQAERLPHAFIGRGQIFEREGRKRKPLIRHTGPAGSQLLGSKHVAPLIERKISEHMQKELDKALTSI